jgi:hypothetical protein
LIPFGLSSAKDRLADKLAVIQQADIAGSTWMVGQEKQSKILR